MKPTNTFANANSGSKIWIPKSITRFMITFLGITFALGVVTFLFILGLDAIVPIRVTNTYYRSGHLKSTFKGHAFFTNRPSLGRIFYPDGKLKLEKSYLGGFLHGPYRLYSSDGKLIFEADFVEGQADGHVYDKQGNLIGNISFVKKLQPGNFWQTVPTAPEYTEEALKYITMKQT